MTFNSFSFYLFFIIVIVVHFLLPIRRRWVWLLVASLTFYGFSDIRFLILLLGLSTFSYLAGVMISKQNEKRARKAWMLASVGMVLGILILHKYLNFFLDSLSTVLIAAGMQWQFRGVKLLYPIGISFYTFQIISYLLDVHSKKISAENNILHYTLYISFFPQLLIGPIERYAHLKPQLMDPAPFDRERMTDGLVRIGWGLFKKFMIADRLAVIANSVFSTPHDFASPKLIMGMLAFSFQIYLDFAAYSDIAIGTAGILGITLTENFDRPYLAHSVIDFWRRWHISLSNWLRDYIFLKLNYQHGRKKPRILWTGLDVMTTFLISGLWHGANWTFILWGLLHGAYQTIELLTQKLRNRIAMQLHLDRIPRLHKAIQIAATFTLISLTWIFFKAESIRQAFGMMRTIFTLEGISAANAWMVMDGSLGLDALDLAMMAGALVFCMIIELLQVRFDLRAVLKRQPIWLRWAGYYGLILTIIIFGFYGEATVVDFVYFQF